MAQSISIALIIAAVLILIYRRKKNLAKDRYLDKNNQALTH
jgi:phosphatidylglycerol---prolipoprotein diacylglyceryl transferase